MNHVASTGQITPCMLASHGRCRVCELVDRDGPHYSAAYRRLFHPEEFGGLAPVAIPDPVAGVSPHPAIPLAGDLVEAMANRIGADRLAKWVEAKLGVPCGCPERRAKLNRLDAAARRFLGWG